ncbi:MAG: tetratricopeptide repeat protein [Rhodocyclaceae bacterium]|jgi:tetratricopeptide (TPR) repeat protein|nr:tetratricopeptide repeat protein [Rhodocyclaceae bacterium]
MKPLLPALLASLLASACTLVPGAGGVRPDEAAGARPSVAGKADAADEDEAEDKAPSLPSLALTPERLYRFLLAEIAGQRGDWVDSATLYRDLARETRDPRIARRATEIAMHGRLPDLALEAARLWGEVEPDSSQARQMLIRLLAIQGRYDELRMALGLLLAAEPRHIGQNLSHLNRLFARGGDRKAILDVVVAVTDPYLAHAEAHYARALAAAEARDLPMARTAARRALELKPDWEAAALLNVQLIENRGEAMEALGDFVAANPQARNARLAYARALVGDKRFQEARRQFGILLEQGRQDPAKNGDVVFALAVLSLQLDDTAEAERHLRKLVEIGHVEADKARYYLGQIAEDGKRWPEALKWFDAVGPGEHYLPARLHGANVLAKQGRLDEARRHLSGTAAADPRQRAQLLIGEAQLLREAGRLADAHAVLAAGLVKQPDQPELIYETALLAEKLGRTDELESRLRHLIDIKPDHAHALNALGYSLAERNERLPEARTLIEKALELAPNDPFILDSKGWVLFRLGDATAALTVLQQAFGIRPDPEIAAHLGEVLWSLGRQDEARATWEKARRDSPANETLAETLKRLLP